MTSEYKRRMNRINLLRKIPWVSEIPNKVPCDGIKWHKVFVKHVRYHGPNEEIPPLGIPDNVRCQMAAHWHFVALKNSTSTTGNYCIHHLVRSIEDDVLESERFNAELARQHRVFAPSTAPRRRGS